MGSLPHSFQSSIAPKQEHNMGALRETPRELGFRSPGSPGFHFTFHFRIHFHKNLLFKCSCEAKPIILTKRWGDSDLLRGGQRIASKQTSTISTSEKIRACSDILSDTLSGKSHQSLQPSFAALSSRAIFMFRWIRLSFIQKHSPWTVCFLPCHVKKLTCFYEP